MKNIYIAFLCLFLFNTNKSISQTNFIVIFVDDMGYGDLGSYGHPTISTPNLDMMAREGQKWTQFYSASSVCTPSRAALLTGRLPIRNGMIGSKYRVLFQDSKYGLPSSEITIAERLKDKGYVTAAVGKWHLGHKKKYLPLQHGFDYYYGIPYSNDMEKVKGTENYMSFMDDPDWVPNTMNYNVPLIEGNEVIERPADQNTITKRYSEKAVEFIKKNAQNNFFLYLAHSLPHIPLFASKEFLGTSKAGLYGDVIEEIDHGVGLIIEELKKNNIDKNTIIVFTSDNGPWLPFKTHGGSSGLLREGKGTTWEGGHRVPGIFWGADIKPGVINDLGSTMDILPTFLEISNSKKIDDRILDGISLKNTLYSKEKSKREKVIYYRQREIHAIRHGDFKAHFILSGSYNYPKLVIKDFNLESDLLFNNSMILLDGNSKKIVLEKPLLYNLNIDPSEKFNIANEYPEVLKKIIEIKGEHEKNLVVKDDLLLERNEKNIIVEQGL